MSNPWYQTFTLVVSNAPIWCMTLRLLWRRKLPDAVFPLLVGLASPFYHICYQTTFCFGESIDTVRPNDHYYVWLLGFWELLSTTREDIRFVMSLSLIAQWFFTTFPSYLIGTMVFPIVFGIFFLVYFISMNTLIARDTMHFSAIFLAWAVMMMTIGLTLYYFAYDISSPSFWWLHSIWHFLAQLAIWIYDEAKDSPDVLGFFGLSSLAARADEYTVSIFSGKRRTKK